MGSEAHNPGFSRKYYELFEALSCLSSTPCFFWVQTTTPARRTVSTVCRAVQTVETVPASVRARNTQPKQDANERPAGTVPGICDPSGSNLPEIIHS